jgi:hypothetical protein
LDNVVKIGIGLAFIGGILYIVHELKSKVKDFEVNLKSIGKPRIQSGVLTIPLDVQFSNPTGIPVTVKNFVADLYIKKNNQWVKGGVIQKPVLEIGAGTSVQRIEPKVDIRKIFGGNILDTLQSLLTSAQQSSIEVKADAHGTANGIDLKLPNLVPAQTISI